MKVSVIVPNYNHEKYLKQRIESILNQTFMDFELIILDDCSTDSSRAIIDEYARKYSFISYYYNQINSGSPFKQWNMGVRKSKGEYLWIAESDDTSEPDFLEKSVEILDKNRNTGLVYCNSVVVDEQKNTFCLASDWKKDISDTKWLQSYSAKGKNEISECLYLKNTINNVSGVLFRKCKYTEAGYADGSMKYCGDWLLYVRILLVSDIEYISSTLNTLRIHSSSTTHNYFGNSRYIFEYLKVYILVLFKINLSVPKKIAMARRFLGLVKRSLIVKT